MSTKTLFALFLLTFLSCIGKKSALAPIQPEESAPVFCSISFFSIGYGIDGQGLKSVQNWAQQKKDSVVLQQTPWGREGEVDVCLRSIHYETEIQRWLTDLKGIRARAKNCRISNEKSCRK